MRLFVSMIALSIGVTTATPAHAGAGQWGTDLHFVAETKISNPSGTGTMSMCHVVDNMSVFYVPVYTTLKGYALSDSGCMGATFRNISPENVVQMQASGQVTNTLPATPVADPTDLLWGHAWLILGGAALLLKGASLIGRRRKDKSGFVDPLALNALIAMSQVAVADGKIDDGEVHQIANILTRLTGTSFGPPQVMQMLINLNPSPSDLAQIGQELSEKDRELVLEAALNIAVADGEIHPSEYAVVSDLAQRMRIGADQFRRALASISAHLKTIQPA